MASRVAIVGLLALTAAGCTRQPAASEQANASVPGSDEASAAATATAPKAGAVDRSHKGAAAPAAKLTDLDGKPATLTGTGKPLMVNLWATWCAPCIAEMPTLDEAAARIDAVALNQGDAAAKVRPFMVRAGIAHLRPLLDPGMAVSLGLNANLPTTILYDAQGKEVWRVTGGRDWSSPESRKLIAEAG